MKLSKKLLPIHAKKAWKNLTSNLHSKFNKLKNSRFIKTTTHRLLSSRFFHFLIPFTRRVLGKSSYGCYQNGYHCQYYCHHHMHRRYPSVYIDDLFDKPPPVASNSRNVSAKGETSGAVEEFYDKRLPEKKSTVDQRSGTYSVDEVWKQVVARAPQLRCVDERAEEFISKFKEDIKIQREKSLLEYQDMLKRSA